jgi:hypothetical protein
MTEPFGIIGIIGVAAQIIQIGVQFGLDWRDAPDDAKSFIAELQALKTVLSETNTNVIINQDFADAFTGRHSTFLSQLGGAAQTDTQGMVSACREGLDSLLEDLRKRLQGQRVGWERLKGAFRARKTRKAVENLHRQCLALNNLVVIDTIALVASTHREVKEGRDEQQQMHSTLNHLLSRHDSREMFDEQDIILSWLTSTDYISQQNDFFGCRQAGTGRWLLDTAEFQSWMRTEKQTLFCPGIPGAGKTILTSILIDELTTRFRNDEDIGIAYIYCNFRRQDEQRAEDLFASLLKQLARNRLCLPEIVKSLYNEHKDKQTRPSFDELSKALQLVAVLYSRIFIVVDALDECHASDGFRPKFLSEIFTLQDKCKASIFATSRFIPEITSKFIQSMSVEIRARDEDVKRYLEGHMKQLPSFVERNQQLQEEIKTKISGAVDGMYAFRLIIKKRIIGN